MTLLHSDNSVRSPGAEYVSRSISQSGRLHTPAAGSPFIPTPCRESIASEHGQTENAPADCDCQMAGNQEHDDYCHLLNLNCLKDCRRSTCAAHTSLFGFLPRIFQESHTISQIVAPARKCQSVISDPADAALTAGHQIGDTGAVALAARQQAQFADDACGCVVAVSGNDIHPTSMVQYRHSNWRLDQSIRQGMVYSFRPVRA